MYICLLMFKYPICYNDYRRERIGEASEDDGSSKSGVSW